MSASAEQASDAEDRVRDDGLPLVGTAGAGEALAALVGTDTLASAAFSSAASRTPARSNCKPAAAFAFSA